MVHLIKMAVGIESFEHLAQRQAERMRLMVEAGQEPVLRHITRNTPRRATELCEKGSLYWVIRGFIAARQRVLACEPSVNSEGRPSCALVLDPALVRTQMLPKRPFQGWRYLPVAKAPPDVIGSDDGSDDLPAEMADELRTLGLL